MELLESRQLFSITLPQNLLTSYNQFTARQPKVVTHASTSHSSSKKTLDQSVLGTYTGTAHTPFGSIPVVLVVTAVSKKGTTGQVLVAGKTYSGTFSGALQPGKYFKITKKIDGIKVTFEGKLSADGKTFNGDANARVFIKSFKGDLHLEKVVDDSTTADAPTVDTTTTDTSDSASDTSADANIPYIDQSTGAPGELI